jgi:hypothetical protein
VRAVYKDQRQTLWVRVHSCEIAVQQMWRILRMTNPSFRRRAVSKQRQFVTARDESPSLAGTTWQRLLTKELQTVDFVCVVVVVICSVYKLVIIL